MLIAWTLVIWAWMYALRLPAMQAANIDPQDAAHPGSLNALPASVRQVADNYNHNRAGNQREYWSRRMQPGLFCGTRIEISALEWALKHKSHFYRRDLHYQI